MLIIIKFTRGFFRVFLGVKAYCILPGMFIRKLKNRSGKTYVQVIDKSSGKYKVLKSIGSSNDAGQIEQLVRKGNDWIEAYTGKMEFDFTGKEQFIEVLFNSIDSLYIGRVMILLLGKLFDEIGFNKINDETIQATGHLPD